MFLRLPFALDSGTSDINNIKKLKPITESAVTCGKESAVSQEILQNNHRCVSLVSTS